MKSAGSAASARTKRKKLKIRGIEGLREKIFQAIGFGFAGQVDQHQLHVAAKLPENLPAGAAGRCEIFGIGGHGHAAELADAFRDCLEHGHAFGAEGEAVGGILHVAPGVNPAVAVFDGRAHEELGEWREGIEAGGQGGGDQRVRHAHLDWPNTSELRSDAQGGALCHWATFTPPTWAAGPSRTLRGYRGPWRRSRGLPRDGFFAVEFRPPCWSRRRCRAPSCPCGWPRSLRARSTCPPRRRRWRAGSESRRESRSWGRAWRRTRLPASARTTRWRPVWLCCDTPWSRPRTYRGSAGPENRRWGPPAGCRLAG